MPKKRARQAKRTTARKAATGDKRAAAKVKSGKREARLQSGETVLLSGGNPQIAKGYGDAPVRAYVAAMPGWKRKAGERLDALIERVVPGVHKAVKWNSPFYGVEGRGWFLSLHCFAKYIKVAFFRGASLSPPPPIGSKHPQVRYVHVFEDTPLDDEQLESWVQQASALPGEKM